MNASINHRELTYKAVAGLAGGAIGWLPVEIASHGHSLTEAVSTPYLIASYVTMSILSGMIGGLILASDEQKFELSPTVRNRFILGFVLCAILMIPGNYYANIVFSQILNFGGFPNVSMFWLVFARAVSWMMMGTMLGAGVGIAGFLGSTVPQVRARVGSINFPAVNIIKGAAGGWIGGFAGGLFFDPIGIVTAGGGLASRLIGLSLIGLAIGLLIGLVQELTKAAWLTVDAGRLKGRQYRLEGGISSIGRAEENPVGLFGDSAVQARHAVIEHRGNDYVLRGLAVADGTFVNGERIESATLHDGDRIRLGAYELSFHLRGVKATPSMRVESRPAPTYAAPPLVASNGAVLVDAGGNSFPIQPAKETRIGRATDNDIVLVDSSVSRHHAAIESRNGRFQVRDLGSQNGTFVRGERISEAPLKNGDPVRVGDASFTFRA